MMPTSLNLPILGTGQVQAVPRDASGNALADRSVVWSSSDPLVASVNGTGLVTGLVLGSATITATVEGVTGSVPVTVSLLGSPPPEPPPPGAWPNLPAGFTTLSDQSFNAPLSGLWSLIWNDLGLGGLASDAGAPFSPSGVMQFKYPIGFPGGESPGTVVIKLGSLRRVFVGLWWKANAEWQGHASNVNKIQFLFPPDGNGDMYMAAYGPPGGPYELRTALQVLNADTRDWLKPNASPGIVTMGTWHRIEWLVDFGTPGARDGVARWWLDGQLVGDYTDILFPSLPLDNYKVAPTWGGMGDFKQRTDYFWYDHVIIARP